MESINIIEEAEDALEEEEDSEDVARGEDVTAAKEEVAEATMILQLQRTRDPVPEPTLEIQRSLTTTLIITLTIA